jgi:hypothetical protein
MNRCCIRQTLTATLAATLHRNGARWAEPVEPESPIAMQLRIEGFGNPPRPFFRVYFSTSGFF